MYILHFKSIFSLARLTVRLTETDGHSGAADNIEQRFYWPWKCFVRNRNSKQKIKVFYFYQFRQWYAGLLSRWSLVSLFSWWTRPEVHIFRLFSISSPHADIQCQHRNQPNVRTLALRQPWHISHSHLRRIFHRLRRFYICVNYQSIEVLYYLRQL